MVQTFSGVGPGVRWFFKRKKGAEFQVLIINQAFTALQLQTTGNVEAECVERLVVEVRGKLSWVFE